MSNAGAPDSSIVEQLKKLLTKYGTELLKPSDPIEELLRKLDRLEYVLLHTLQEHKKFVEMFLQPSKEALIADELIRHDEFDVRVSAASFISQIIRITAPDEPYEEGYVKVFYLLANSAFEILPCMSGRAYSKAVSILHTMSNTQSCVLMLDLEMYATVGHMFHLFLDVIRTSHPSEVFSSMENFMMVINRNTVDNDEFLLVLVKILLNSLRRENQDHSEKGQGSSIKVVPVGIKQGEHENMCNAGAPDSSIVVQLKKLLTKYGTDLLKPCDSTEELLRKLDRLEHVLVRTLQKYKKLVEMLLQPSKEALIANEFITHSELYVRVSVASCISQIIRITAPDEPYEEDLMKEVFLLANSAFEMLSFMSGQTYSKAVSILHTMSNTQSCVMMLDLEMYATIGHMFHVFLNGIRTSHPSEAFSSMEKIMMVTIRNTVDNDEFLMVLVKILLNSLRRENQRLEYVLLHTLQEHKKFVEMFLQPSKEALIADERLRHSEFDVRVSADSYTSRIIRITGVSEPYEEGHMKEFFLLANSSFEILSCMSGRAYSKAVSILHTMSNTQSCVMMLDLEMYATVGHMFHLFLDGIRTSHPSEVFSSMEIFMTVINGNTVDNDEFLLVLRAC